MMGKNGGQFFSSMTKPAAKQIREATRNYGRYVKEEKKKKHIRLRTEAPHRSTASSLLLISYIWYKPRFNTSVSLI